MGASKAILAAADRAPPVLRRRIVPAGSLDGFPVDMHPVMRRVYAGRGIAPGDVDPALSRMLVPGGLKGIGEAAAIMVDAMLSGLRIFVAGDFDSDGAGGTAAAVLGLRALGARHVDYVVPDRVKMGYGLSPALVDLAASRGAQVLLTVDNGITSFEGIRHAKVKGLTVVCTDHHVCASSLPDADAIINPNQPGCDFGSRNLCGAGVAFYLVWAVRSLLKQRGVFEGRELPQLTDLLPFIAISTVGDVVRLDYNNRILVEQGLRRMRAGAITPGLRALIECSGRPLSLLGAEDIAFKLSAMINAAGRMDDMRVGIECLISQDGDQARALAGTLNELNQSRRQVQQQMQDDAAVQLGEAHGEAGIVLFSRDWPQGVIGPVAGKIKEQYHRPTFAWAPAGDGMLKGSGRSIPGVNLRDVLADIDREHPGLIERFGGHASACAAQMLDSKLETFKQAFEIACARVVTQDMRQRVIETDGPLDASDISLDLAHWIERGGPWGQGCEAPCFEGSFHVVSARMVGKDANHAQYRLRAGAHEFKAVEFFCERGRPAPAGSKIDAVFQIKVNRFAGRTGVDLLLRHLAGP
jgi:single-stranded-DNA-specific exonuclease